MTSLLITDSSARKVEIPGTDDGWASIRPLTWGEVKQARITGSQQAIKEASDMARDMDSDLLAKLPQRSAEDRQEPSLDQQFSFNYVLATGLLDWSSPEKLESESIAKLPGATAEFLVRSIIDLSVLAADQGEGSGVSSSDTSSVTAPGQRN